MSDSPGFTLRTQTLPMTSWAEQSPNGRHSSDLLTSQVSSAGPVVALASLIWDAGGAWAHPEQSASTRRSAPARAYRAEGEVDEENTVLYMPASGEGVNGGAGE
jgi:hypothetical protein